MVRTKLRYFLLTSICFIIWAAPAYGVKIGNVEIDLRSEEEDSQEQLKVEKESREQKEREQEEELARIKKTKEEELAKSQIDDLNPGNMNSENNGTDNPNNGDTSPAKNFSCLGSHAIADWLNAINVGSFFDETSKYVCRNNKCFVVFDSFKNITFWLEPYGLYSHYRSPSKDGKVDLTVASGGARTGARYSIGDELYLCGAVGYFHSKLSCKDNDSNINGVYFGPAIEYLYPEGSVGLTVFGMGNFYNHDHSWDIDVRLEGDYYIETSSDFFIKDLSFRPNLRIDYLNVLEEKNSSFLSTNLAVRLEKIVSCTKSQFLTSNIDVGWAHMLPLLNRFKLETKNQLLLGYELVGMSHNGWLMGVGYQAVIGANSPIQTGRIRIEWNW